MDSLPPELSHSVKQGFMSTELLQRWLHWEQRYLLRHLLRFPGTPVLASGCVKVWSQVNVCSQHAQTVKILTLSVVLATMHTAVLSALSSPR